MKKNSSTRQFIGMMIRMNFSKWLTIPSIASLLFTPTLSALAMEPDPAPEQWSYNMTQVYDAWEKAQGSKDIVVAVLDNGFDHFHPDLYDNVWRNPGEIARNGIDDDNNGFIDDIFGWDFAIEDRNDDGDISDAEKEGDNDPRPSVLSVSADEQEIIHHGTVIAGIIGAVGQNGQDSAGINQQVSLMNIRVADNSGAGALSQVPKAIRYAVDNGADVINISLVGRPMTQAIEDAVDYAFENNVMIVAAAGNNNEWLNENPIYPICSDTGEQKVLGVSAIRENRQVAGFTNFGSDCVDITAPGVNIQSTQRFAPSFGFTESYGGRWNGTSFAAPFVTGALALVKSVQPNWTATQVYDAVLNTTHQTPPRDPEVYANLFGNGLLQIADAVQYALDRVEDEPINDGEIDVRPTPIAIVAPPSNEPRLKSIGALIGDTVYVRQRDGSLFRKQAPLLTGASTISPLHTNQGSYLLAVVPNGNRQDIVIVDEQLSLVAKFNSGLVGNLTLATKEADSLAQSTILVSGLTAQGNMVGFEYNAQGLFIGQVPITLEKEDRIVGYATASNGMTDYIVLRKDDNWAVEWYTDAGELEQRVALTQFVVQPIVHIGQLDDDIASELVIASAAGTSNWLMYLDNTGDRLRLFSPFASSKTGYTVTLRDTDADGIDDMIITPKTGERSLRVWSARVKRLDTIELPTDNTTSPLHLFTF